MYKNQTIQLIKKNLPEFRATFRKEYAHALENHHDFMLSTGFRFHDTDRVIRKLQETYDEEFFLSNMPFCMNLILLNLAGSDYYYTYEKEW